MKKELIKEMKLPFLSTVISGIITHFLIFTTESMAPDALSAGTLRIAGKWEVSLGRWGIAFLDSIRGGIVNKFLIIIVSLIFLGIASSIICKILNIKSNIGIILISALLSTMPQVSEAFMFIYCADSYCLAFLTATLSAYYIIKSFENKKYNIFIAILLGLICLSIYQAYISVTIVLMILYFIRIIINDNIENKEIFLRFVKSMFYVFVSMICYFIITKLVLRCMGIEFSSYKGANSLSLISIIKSLPITLIDSYRSVYHFLFKDNILRNRFWHRNIYNALLCLVNMALIIYMIIKTKLYKNKIKIVLLCFLFLVIPLGINVINIIMPWNKINIVTGPSLFCIMFYFVMMIENLNNNNNIYTFLKSANIVVISILVFTYIMSDNATYMARQEVFTNYYSISSNILQNAHNLEGYSKEKKWIFTDNIRYKSKFSKMANGFISDDYETWNVIDGIWMNYQFYDRYLGEKIKMASKEEYYRVVETEEVKKMEAYPSKNSVKIIGEYIVVKIGNENYAQRNRNN